MKDNQNMEPGWTVNSRHQVADAAAKAHPRKPKIQHDVGMRLSKFMPVQFGRVKAQIFGGPFVEYVPGQRRLVSVKMAAEIDHPHDISIPTEDFDVPEMSTLHAGIQRALEAILSGNDIYVGCRGGIGRTGLFMACMAKVMLDYLPGSDAGALTYGWQKKYDTDISAVAYVRKHYLPHAVETPEQQEFVMEFDTSRHVENLMVALDQKPVEVIREVPVFHFNPFLAVLQFFGKR